jgi:adenylate cyclase
MVCARVTDFDALGLLDGLEGDARASRLRLLERLEGDGVPVEELERAVADERLVLLPVERFISGEGLYTVEEVIERAGVDPSAWREALRAGGVPAREGEPIYGENDVAQGEVFKNVLDTGLPIEAIVEFNRVVGRSMAQIAAAARTFVGGAFIEPGTQEDEAAARLLAATEGLLPTVAPTLSRFFALHLLEVLRTDAIGATELQSGRLGRARERTVAFADLVGFTRLGEELPPEDVGQVAARLEAMAMERVEAPVTLVKTVGDAVMLVSPHAEPLLELGLTLVEAADAEGADFPQLRVGLACGAAVERSGDWYGQPVNLASRVTGAARAGTVLATREVRDNAGEDAFRWSAAGTKKLRGVGPVRLYRARRAEPDD